MTKFLLILISSLVFSSCSTIRESTQSFEPISCSTIAKQPASNVPDLNIEIPCIDGKISVLLSQIKGPALINVWASWCEPCREEIPIFNKLYRLNAGKIQIIGIDVEEKNKEVGIKFALEMGMNWPQLFDNKRKTVPIFGTGIPVTLFIDKEGNIVYKKIGSIDNFPEITSLIKDKIKLDLN